MLVIIINVLSSHQRSTSVRQRVEINGSSFNKCGTCLLGFELDCNPLMSPPEPASLGGIRISLSARSRSTDCKIPSSPPVLSGVGKAGKAGWLAKLALMGGWKNHGPWPLKDGECGKLWGIFLEQVALGRLSWGTFFFGSTNPAAHMENAPRFIHMCPCSGKSSSPEPVDEAVDPPSYSGLVIIQTPPLPTPNETRSHLLYSPVFFPLSCD